MTTARRAKSKAARAAFKRQRSAIRSARQAARKPRLKARAAQRQAAKYVERHTPRVAQAPVELTPTAAVELLPPNGIDNFLRRLGVRHA